LPGPGRGKSGAAVAYHDLETILFVPGVDGKFDLAATAMLNGIACNLGYGCSEQGYVLPVQADDMAKIAGVQARARRVGVVDQRQA
jgi:hypothetical protein